MSKHLLTIILVFMYVIAFGNFTPSEVEFMNRRRAVKRERITIGTNEYWVVTYMKGAKLDCVKTNLAYKIEGKPQTNPMEEGYMKTERIRKAKKNAEKKDTKNLEKAIKDLEKARDKSSESMREVYDSVLNILEEKSNGN